MLSCPGIWMHLPPGSNLRPWYMQRMSSPSRRPFESLAPRWQQRLSSATTRALSPLYRTTGLSKSVRARSLPSISSWSHAATYQQFCRKPCVSGPINVLPPLFQPLFWQSFDQSFERAQVRGHHARVLLELRVAHLRRLEEREDELAAAAVRHHTDRQVDLRAVG